MKTRTIQDRDNVVKVFIISTHTVCYNARSRRLAITNMSDLLKKGKRGAQNESTEAQCFWTF